MRKKAKERKGLILEQVAELDARESLEEQVEQQARKLHNELFPEEYDFVYDSIADAADRRRDINPMSGEYIERVAEKRQKLGGFPLADNGMPISNDTFQLCLEKAREMFRDELAKHK